MIYSLLRYGRALNSCFFVNRFSLTRGTVFIILSTYSCFQGTPVALSPYFDARTFYIMQEFGKMIKRSKMIAGVLLFTMLLSGISEGFGTVTTVYADEPAASVEKTEEPESGEQNPEDDDLDEANPSEEEKKIIDEKSSAAVEESDKKEDVPDEQKDDHPAFNQSKTVNGVKVTVEADAGVFPENAKLSVTSVSSSKTEKEVDKERDDKNVAVSYTFDIKVLDEEDNELQPAEDQNVKVSFRTAEVADPNLEVSVYHISEEEGAEELDVDVSGQTAVAESDGFSYYTVEFTYNDLQYVLAGDESVALSEILSAVGLVGEATEVTVSNPELFSASKENGRWIITAHKAFSSDEWMKVTIGDITYEITVTDDPATSGTCGANLTWTFDSTTRTLTISGIGAMYDYSMTSGSRAPWFGLDIRSVVINSGVTTIGNAALFSLINITNITIPESVVSIGDSAFAHCSNLSSISFPSHVTSIGSDAFLLCNAIESITLPSGLQSISNRMFRSCQNLRRVTIPSGVISIGESAFTQCGNLESITIPSSVTTVGNNAFHSCGSLTTVNYDGTAQQWDAIKNLFPNSVTTENYVLTVDASPSAGGTVSVAGATSVSGSTGVYTYTTGNDVTLTATAGTGYSFAYWTKNGEVVSFANPYTFSPDGGGYVAHFSNLTVLLSGTAFTYNGSAQTVISAVKEGDTVLTTDDYDIEYQKQNGSTWTTASPLEAGTYRAVVTGKRTYAGSTVIKNFVINPMSVTITARDASKTYDGAALTDSSFSSTDLPDTHTFNVVMTTDSTITNAGTQPNVIATVDGIAVTTGTATSIGNYLVTTVNGTLTVSSKAVTVTAQDHEFTYDGNAHSWPRYDVTGLVGSDAITATITGSITSVNESPVTNVVSSYSFTSGTPGNYSVTTQNGQLTMTNNPAPQPPAAKHDDDNSSHHHDDSSSSHKTNNQNVPDGFEEPRLMLSSAIATAKVTGTPQTVYWNKGTSLPYDVMKTLHDNPMITLVFTYKYLGMDFNAVIPGSTAYATPAIQWYGPIYLYLLYGNTKAPAATGSYTIKSGDTLSGIAKRLNTTVQHLKDVNSIRNINEIKAGMAIKY